MPGSCLNQRLPLTGGCQCGAVRYEIGAMPTLLYACHCKGCQKQSGSAFGMSLFVSRAAVAITAGTPKVWHCTTESGRTQTRLFCGDCGSRLFHNPDANPDQSVLKPGTLDDTGWLRPVAHIFAESAQPWVHLSEEDALVYRNRGVDFPAMLAAWQRALAAGS